MQRQTTGMSYLLKDKQFIQQITRPRMGKKTQAVVQHLRGVVCRAVVRTAGVVGGLTLTTPFQI